MEEANLEDEGVMIMPQTPGPRGNPEVKVTIGVPIPEMADQRDTTTIRFLFWFLLSNNVLIRSNSEF